MPVEAKLVLGPELNGIVMSPEEFDAVDEFDDNYRYELINGVLVVNPLPLDSEVGPNEELGFLLRLYRHQHPEGESLDDTLPERYVRTRTSRRRADRLIWAGLGRQPHSRVDPATIAVEFVSRSRRDQRRDYQEKRKDYREAGLAEYWIIDRFRRLMTVILYSRRGTKVVKVREDEVYRTPRLPGFELSLGHLLAVADRYEEQARAKRR